MNLSKEERKGEGLPVEPSPHHHELLTGALEEGRMSAGIGRRMGAGGRKIKEGRLWDVSDECVCNVSAAWCALGSP